MQSGIGDVAMHLKDDVQKAADDDVSNGQSGTRLGLNDSSQKVEKRAELQDIPTTPGLSQKISLGPQASPATDLLTKVNMTPSQHLVTIHRVVTTMGGSGKPQSFSRADNYSNISPQQYTTPQHAPNTTPHPNANSQTPFNTPSNPATYTYPLTQSHTNPAHGSTHTPPAAMFTPDSNNITCPDRKELRAGTGYFCSPGYPEKYPPLQCITWHITTDHGNCITITFEAFSLEGNLICKYDKVWVVTNGKTRYGPMCSTDLPRRRRGREVQLTFRSDGSFEKTGFKVHYSSQPWDGPGCG
ncbi:uncharacterized protein LOC144919300 [Branchiostoma floridae x Branchiostoma belcheri]